MGSNNLTITSGVLKSTMLVIQNTRVAVHNYLNFESDTVKLDYNIEVRYSIEVFLYKLYKFAIIGEADYKKFVRVCQG